MGWFDSNSPTVSGPNGEVLSGGGGRRRPNLQTVGGSDGSLPTLNAGVPMSNGNAPVSYPEAGSNYSGGQIAPPAGSTGAANAPGGGVSAPAQYTQQWFSSTFGSPSTPSQLVGMESALNAQGIKVLRNAAGVAGKIQLPNGQIVDVINSAGLGGRGFQWLTDEGGGGGGGGVNLGNFQTGTFTGGGQYPLASVMGTGLMQPWTTPFNSQQYNFDPNQYAFTAPTDVTEQNDPGFRFRLDEGLKAIQRSAASKGTLLTGGTLKDAMAFNQNLASNEYGNVYGRARDQNELAYTRGLQGNQLGYSRGLQDYLNAYNIYNQNQQNQYNMLSGVASLGQSAASGSGNANTGYANQASNTLTNAGNAAASGITSGANATAAGQVASGNAWGNAAQSVANTLGNVGAYYGANNASRPSTSSGYAVGRPNAYDPLGTNNYGASGAW